METKRGGSSITQLQHSKSAKPTTEEWKAPTWNDKEALYEKVDLEVGKYEGAINEAGQPHGHGKFTWPDDSVFIGDWLNGKRHGKGKFVRYDGYTHEGAYDDDLKHGQGRELDLNGWEMEANFVKGRKHGTGSIREPLPSLRKGPSTVSDRKPVIFDQDKIIRVNPHKATFESDYIWLNILLMVVFYPCLGVLLYGVVHNDSTYEIAGGSAAGALFVINLCCIYTNTFHLCLGRHRSPKDI